MSLQSLIATGTKLWLDSIEPQLVRKNRALGSQRRHFQSDHHFRHSQVRLAGRCDGRPDGRRRRR